MNTRGKLASAPRAKAFAAEVRRVHERYATEVVLAYRLCPFLRDMESGFGIFNVMLETDLDVALACAAVAEAKGAVTHLVYPLVTVRPADFERFAAAISRELKRTLKSPPVQATFHPELAGDPDSPHRMVGLLRRAPDPFVQFIPEGLPHGGTVIAGADPSAPAFDPAKVNFDRLAQGDLATVLALQADIRADRDRSYAPFMVEFGRRLPDCDHS